MRPLAKRMIGSGTRTHNTFTWKVGDAMWRNLKVENARKSATANSRLKITRSQIPKFVKLGLSFVELTGIGKLSFGADFAQNLLI
jgi:hypothetical protein